jgi:hypothetical protein
LPFVVVAGAFVCVLVRITVIGCPSFPVVITVAVVVTTETNEFLSKLINCHESRLTRVWHWRSHRLRHRNITGYC